MDSKSKEVLVIIGNGFDLSLGLETSYKQFYKSEFWPFNRSTSIDEFRVMLSDSMSSVIRPLDLFKPSYILNNYLDTKMCQNWYNLELLLKRYALISKAGHRRVTVDSNSFSQLKLSLYEFIKEAQNKFVKQSPPDPNNKAARFMRAICNNRIPIIYTFNYTNLPLLAGKIGIRHLVCTHVHGSIQHQDLILGIEDDSEVPPAYDFLKKVSDPNYKSNNLYYDLMKAEDVIIYGHSLGENDFHFFRQFFKIHSDENNSDVSNRCNITIFTANSESRMDILAKLRNMNDGKNNQLFAQNNLQFVRTLDNDQEFEDWISQYPVHFI